MLGNANSGAAGVDQVPHAWIESLEDGFIFIGTHSRIAGFNRQRLPPHWSAFFKAPEGNLALAQKIDRHGSPAETPLALVARLDWPQWFCPDLARRPLANAGGQFRAA